MKIIPLSVIADTLLARAARPFRCNLSSNQNLKEGKGRQARALASLFLSAPLLCAVVSVYGESTSADAEISELKARIERLEEEKQKAEAGSAAELPEWLKSIEIHGFLSTAYTWNFNDPASDTNQLRVFDFRHNSFRVDDFQFSLLRRAKDPGSVGFRFDLDVGSNIPDVIQSSGLFDDPEGEDIDVRQAFVSYNAPIGNGLTIDAGKYITHIGLEVIEGWENFNDNYSRSFNFGLAIPFTHTGVRVSYPVTEQLSLMATVANGWDQVDDVNDAKAFGGQIGYFPMEGVSLYFNYLGSPEQDDDVPGNDEDNWRHLFGLVWVTKPLAALPDLTFSGGFDYVIEEDACLGLVDTDGDGVEDNCQVSLGAIRGDAEWYAVEAILRYDFTPWFYVALRGEWFRDDDGVRTGTAQDLYAVTFTPTFKVTDNVVVRPEVRADFSEENVFEDDDGAFTEDTQVTGAVNAIFYF